MDYKMNIEVLCPVCKLGKVYADKKTDAHHSYICNKCQHAFVVDWNTLKAYPGKKMKIE